MKFFIKKIIYKTMIDTKTNIKETIIQKLKEQTDNSPISTLKLSREFSIDHQEVIGDCKYLEMAEVITLEKQEEKFIQLTSDGKE